MQMEALECGAACLAMICAYYGKWIPLEQVRKDCGVSRDGSRADNIQRAAQSYGLKTRSFRANMKTLTLAEFPAIIHWGFNHFVVLRGIKGEKAYINDPGRGEVIVPLEEFKKQFTGVLLSMKPGPDFQPEGSQPSVLRFLSERLKNSRDSLVLITAITALVSILGLISPLLSQTFTDKMIGGQNPQLVAPFFFILVVLLLLQAFCSFLSSRYLLRAQGKMAVAGSASFMWRIMRLPMEFFSQRSPADLVNRLSLNTSVASTVVGQLAPIAIQFVTAIVCLVIMIGYNAPLAAVGVAMSVLKIIVARVISSKRVNMSRVTMRDSANMSNTTVSGFKMIETLKATGGTGGFFQRWSGYQASLNDQQVNMSKLSVTWGLLPNILTSLADATIIVMGLFFIIDGSFTIGSLLAFQGILAQFSAPLQQLIVAMQTIQETRTSMERIEDVMHYDIDELNPVDDEDVTDESLSGAVKIEHLTFGYSRLEEPLIKDFSLDLKQGGSIAFVGPSGCGKSTLAKLISGLYEPWEGTISFDGVPLQQIPRSKRSSSISVVDQDITLFHASVMDNLKMFEKSIPDFVAILAAEDADIHESIIERPGGYDYMMAEGGMDFSGGQRQRMEIARALTNEPSILVLDEATSALDAKTELRVMESIKGAGITTIMVTHRLSAIRDCDEIIVMDRGEVVQRGTHEQLMQQGGLYEQLMTQE